MLSSKREIQSVRHPLKMRLLNVKRVQPLAPHMVRITLGGEALSDFVSSSPDDHVKVFFPYPGEETPIIPEMTAEGPKVPEGSKKPIMRDYTPRRYDAGLQELDLDFYLHEGGEASAWAQQAKVGQTLGVGGPRGSRVVPYEFDWYFMIGDETAIPSIARRLAEMPKGAPAIAVIEVENEAEKIDLEAGSPVKIHWVYRDGRAPGDVRRMHEYLLKLEIPTGDYFAWVAGENTWAQEIKELLLTVKGAEEEWLKATGYWRIS